MRYLYIIFNLFIATVSFAQTEKTVEVRFGTTVEIPFAPNDPLQKLRVVFESDGNQPVGFDFDITAPKNTEITFESMGYPQKKSLIDAVSSARGSNEGLIAFTGGKFLSKLTVGKKSDTTSGTPSGGSGYVCNGKLSSKHVKFYTDLVAGIVGYRMSLVELCAYLFPEGGDDGSDDQGGGSSNSSLHNETVVGILLKDACVKNLNYYGLLTLNLSNISAEDRTAGFTISISSEGKVYSRSKKFKVKRMGDGKFKEPLFLGEMVGSGSVSGEYHLFTRWSAGKLKNQTKLTFGKTTFYRGAILGVSRPRKLLSGGKATVIVTNGEDGYGVCISAVARDQLFNGYTN